MSTTFGGEGPLISNESFAAGELPNISIPVLNKLSSTFSDGNNISGIEDHRIITIVDGDKTKEGTFIDFNDDEGYATMKIPENFTKKVRTEKLLLRHIAKISR